MSDLSQTAKAVIDVAETYKKDFAPFSDEIRALRAAVKRAEKPPAYFMEWWETFPLKTDDVVPAVHAWEAGFTAAQQAERERIKEVIRAIGPRGRPDAWFDCVDTILERIDEC